MNWQSFAVRQSVGFPSDQQKIAKLNHAARMLSEGLDMLTGIGLVFHLAPGVEPPQPEWPKVLFHINAAPNGRLVRSSWEATELGEGWYESLSAAQHDYGVEQQWRGRAGKTSRGLPIPLAPSDDEVRRELQERESSLAATRRMIEEFKAKVSVQPAQKES